MTLEVEGLPAIAQPDEDLIRKTIMDLRGAGPSFASLTDRQGNYVQVAGGRPWVMVEWRQVSPLIHRRAHTTSGRRPYKDGAKINFGAGSIALQADEWLLQKQAFEIFLAFLRMEDFPDFVRWRTINDQLGLKD